jgi:hypothetical protein
LADEDVRYVARVEVFAAYDPMELTQADLARDGRAELRELLERMHAADPEELEAQVYEEFRFDLCPACRRRYSAELKERGPAGPEGGESEE